MGLLSGNTLQGILGRVFAGIYEDGELIEARKIRQPNGVLRDQIVERHTVKVQLDVVTERMRQAEGYAATDQRAIVLRAGLPVQDITTDFRLLARGKVWHLNEVTTDPARSHFEARATLAQAAP